MGKENTKPKNEKKRLDVLLVERELVPSRTYARAVIMSGVVYVDDQKVDKAGTLVDPGSHIVVRQARRKFVSRGGFKLESAIEHFNVNVSGAVAMDVGASTGGFTDCLLQRGASRVYALDVGYGQLDWGLRNDKRVIVKERVNCRYLEPELIGESVDIVVMDVSFISLTKILEPVLRLLKSNGAIIALIKPQFEVGKEEVGKGGIVKDETKHQKVIKKIRKKLEDLNCRVIGIIPSPITGADGNREFLIYSIKNG